jgi:hypothetical protein
MSERNARIAQIYQELRYLWRPEDRLLTYVQARLVELARLGAAAPHTDREGETDE